MIREISRDLHAILIGLADISGVKIRSKWHDVFLIVSSIFLIRRQIR